MSLDYGQIINSAFSWFKEKEWLKYYILLLVPYILGLVLYMMLISSLTELTGLLTEYYTTMFAFGLSSYSFFLLLLKNLELLPYYAIAFIAIGLLAIGIQLLVYVFALKTKNFSANINLNESITAVILIILTPFIALFHPLNLRQRIIQWVLIIIVVASFFFSITNPMITNPVNTSLLAVTTTLGLISFFVLVIFFVYSVVRYSQSLLVYLTEKKSLFDNFKESWALTKNKAFTVFIAFILIGIIVVTINNLFSFFINFIFSFFSLTLLVSSLIIPLAILHAILLFLIMPFLILISVFGFIEIFRQLKSSALNLQKKE